MEERKEGWIDRWMDGRKEGRKDGRMESEYDINICRTHILNLRREYMDHGLMY